MHHHALQLKSRATNHPRVCVSKDKVNHWLDSECFNGWSAMVARQEMTPIRSKLWTHYWKDSLIFLCPTDLNSSPSSVKGFVSGGKGIGTNSGLYQNNYQYKASLKQVQNNFMMVNQKDIPFTLIEFKYLPKYFHPTGGLPHPL